MEVRVRANDFFSLARDARIAGRKDLVKELNAGLARSVKPIQQAIRVEAEQVMPASGGYRALLTRSLRVRAAKGDLRVRLLVSAKGKSEDRDVRRLNLGELRHPNPPGRFRRVRGRRVVNDWSTTRIRSGFVFRPFDKHADTVEKELAEALGNVAKKLAGG